MTERDTTAAGHGASLEKHKPLSSRILQSDLEQNNVELEQRNRELKAIIQEMRREMEQCVSTDPAAGTGTQRVKDALSRVGNAPYSAEYVGYLERELAEMKAEKRKMAERLDELVAHRKPPTPPPPPLPQSPTRSSSTDSRHRAHLIALSDTIATLQHEKCGLELEVVQLKGKEEELKGVVRLCQEEVGEMVVCAHACMWELACTNMHECVHISAHTKYTHRNTHTPTDIYLCNIEYLHTKYRMVAMKRAITY